LKDDFYGMTKKKRELTEQEHRVYRKTHNYEWPLDEEAAKIARERARYKKLRRQSDARQQEALAPTRNGQGHGDEELDELWDEIDELDDQAQREERNAKTHKRRLRQLRSRLPDGDV
jgi:chromosome segregation ATPase